MARPIPPFPPDTDITYFAQPGLNSPNNHYHDIETLTRVKPKPGRKSSKFLNKSAFWSERLQLENEKVAKKSGPPPTSKKPNQPVKGKKPGPPHKPCKNLSTASHHHHHHHHGKNFLTNPLLQQDRVWTLPRAELWCRDPECGYNQKLWGTYSTRPPKSSNIYPGVDEETDGSQQTSSRGSTSNCDSGIGTGSHSQNSYQGRRSSISPDAIMGINSNHNHTHTHGRVGGVEKPMKHAQLHLNMSFGVNNFGSKDGITITHTNNTDKADNTFTSRRGKNKALPTTVTQTPMDTMGSTATGSSFTNSSSNADSSTILTIESERGESSSAALSPGSTFLNGFDTSTSTTSNSTTSTGTGSGSSLDTGKSAGLGHDIVSPGQPVYANANTNGGSSGSGPLHYGHEAYSRPDSTLGSSNPYCPNCNGVVPLGNHLDNHAEIDERLKGDPGFWHFNKFQHPLQRDHSFHSVGGFTLNGQYNTNVKKHTLFKFCSSHKISLVVSTFSLLATIGLLITLFLMKKRGMMDTMMDHTH